MSRHRVTNGVTFERHPDGAVLISLYDVDGVEKSRLVPAEAFCEGVVKVAHPDWLKEPESEATRALVRRVHLGKDRR